MPVETMVEVINRLESEGYTGQCRATENGISFLPGPKSFSADDLHVDRMIRLEGNSVPSEQTVVFALSSPDKALKATWCVAFGPAMEPQDVKMLQQLELRAAGKAARTDHNAGK